MALPKQLQVIDRPGPEDFASTLSVQTNLLTAKISDPDLDDVLILVEHDDVFTLGRGKKPQPLTEPLPKELRWVEIGRGGDATYHGPGQLVVYPIFSLERHGQDVHVFLRTLEQVGIRLLRRFGVEASLREGLTGIWVTTELGPKKIASIGIGVKRWVSYHGMSINIAPDLRYFRAISPCGQDGEVMTSLKDLGLPVPEMSDVKQALIEEFIEAFGFTAPSEEQPAAVARRARPSWLRVKAPGSPDFQKTRSVVREHALVTVCEEAQCPNIGECWTHSTATFMIMGELCTRRCSFCAVKDGTLSTLSPLDTLEPLRVAQAVKKLGLEHVVITSVNRDDLADMGAKHFDQTARAIHHAVPTCDIEFLIPDMRGRRELVEIILASGLVKVLNHNVETVPRLYREVRPGAVFKRSLDVLRWAREVQPAIRSKSGVMVGLGESKSEVLEVMDRLREADVQVMTIGQYLQPSGKQLPVQRFVTPEEFAAYQEEGLRRGFLHVESGPLVRSSYHAWKHTGESQDTQAQAIGR